LFSIKNAHRVIGQEFDNVIVFIDNHFRYIDNKLQSRTAPNPDHILKQLLFQAVTRCREKLCLVVIGETEIFKNILNILHSNQAVEPNLTLMVAEGKVDYITK